ncbi:MAG: ribonuclease III [Mycoplasma sp.]|nr:ribonuclease III [Mycoplasma sp.]
MKYKHNLEPLFRILGIKPKSIKFYYQALTHKTFSNENREFQSYEKLEFLGDSILQMYSSLYIFNTFPNDYEGTMSIIRANNVSSDSLAKIVKKHKINAFLICSNNADELMNNNKICSDIFESLLAAIYLDLGEKQALKFLNNFLFKNIKTNQNNTENLKDPKTRLQELLQPMFKNPVSYDCKQNNNIWSCKVTCSNIIYGKGQGKTKKEAEINSAKNALKKFKI